MFLYHYTSKQALKQITKSGVLLPSDADCWSLLWATTSSTIDPTARYSEAPVIARITLWQDDFEPWVDVRSRFPKTKRKRAEAMDARMVRIHGLDPKEDWFVRSAALPADRWLCIDVQDRRWRSYFASDKWQQIVNDDAVADARYWPKGMNPMKCR